MRDLKVSRYTVRGVLRSGATSFEYEREVQPRPKLGRWTEKIRYGPGRHAAKPAREQLMLIRILEELRGRGYDGGYDAVRRYAGRWANQHGQATAAADVPLSFAPGEAYQFDWNHEVVLLSGVTVIVKVAQPSDTIENPLVRLGRAETTHAQSQPHRSLDLAAAS